MANLIEKDIGAFSAYAIAVKHGYMGTEAEWNASVNANRFAAEEAATAAAQAQAASEAARDEAYSHRSAASGSAGAAAESARRTASDAEAAMWARESMSYISVEINEDGDLVVGNSQLLGTTAFALDFDTGELEVTY